MPPPDPLAHPIASGERVLYLERGARWASVAVAPLLAALAAGAEVLTGGPVHLLVWSLLGLVGAGGAAVVVRARRALVTVRVTPTEIRFGQEVLAASDLVEVDGVGAPLGARVLGGGWAVPRRTHEVPLRLSDGTAVLGWARRPERLRAALRDLLARRH